MRVTETFFTLPFVISLNIFEPLTEGTLGNVLVAPTLWKREESKEKEIYMETAFYMELIVIKYEMNGEMHVLAAQARPCFHMGGPGKKLPYQ